MGLKWNAPDDDRITGYQILRRRPALGERLSVYVENTGNTQTTYTDRSVTVGIAHVYRVKAITDAGLSERSNSVRVVAVGRPSGGRGLDS